jgi:hypothetical protein
MRATLKNLAAATGVVLPVLPFAICLAIRGAEGWKLWHEMSRATPLGLIVWIWAAAYLLASVVTIFRLDDEDSLRGWELLIDAGNMVTSLVLAVKCADQQLTLGHSMSYGFRFSLWLGICVVVQLTVTFVARRARAVSQRLYQQMHSHYPSAVKNSTGDAALNPPRYVEAAEVGCMDRVAETSDAEANEVLFV